MVFLFGFRKVIVCVATLVLTFLVGSTVQWAAVVLQDANEEPGAPPVPPGAVRLVNFVWYLSLIHI